MTADDLNIELEPIADGAYRLKIEWQRAGDDRPTQFDPTMLNIDWEEARERAITRDMDAYGLWLGEKLLFGQPEARRSFDTAFGGARSRDIPLRLRLDLADAPQSLPWETMRLSDHHRALAVNDRLLVSRYLPSSDVRAAGRPPPADQWRVGLLVANPKGLTERGLAQVSEEEILADLSGSLGPEAISRYKATLGGLQECLDAGHDVLCLAAHGGITERGGEPFVYLESDDGTIRGVTAAKMNVQARQIERASWREGVADGG